jgi:hypothetical protein
MYPTFLRVDDFNVINLGTMLLGRVIAGRKRFLVCLLINASVCVVDLVHTGTAPDLPRLAIRAGNLSVRCNLKRKNMLT